MTITELKFKVASIVDTEDFRILTFGVKSVTANVDGLNYTDAFEDYLWVQTKCATKIGVAVHPYGAIIVPKGQLESASLDKFLVKVDGRYGSCEATDGIGTLSVDSEVTFKFETDGGDEGGAKTAVVGTAIVGTDVVG